MIDGVEILRMRGIESGELRELAPLTVLVGPNGAGKSTVLEAMLIAAAPDSGSAIGYAVQKRQEVVNGVRWLPYRQGARGGSWVRVTSLAEARKVEFERIKASPSVLQCGLSPDATAAGRVTTRFQVGFDRTNTFKTNHRPLPWKSVRETRLIDARVGTVHASLHKLYSTAVEQGRKPQALALVRELLPAVQDIVILTDEDEPIVHLVFEDHSVPVGLGGDGVNALVRISFELASRAGGLALLEEPETHQHPAAIRQSARAILAAVERDVQVIVSTHSLELIDSLLAEAKPETLRRLALFRINLDAGKLKSTRFSHDEILAARSDIEEDLR